MAKKKCTHMWAAIMSEWKKKDAKGCPVVCVHCDATGWQPAKWEKNPAGVWGFWPHGEVIVDEVPSFGEKMKEIGFFIWRALNPWRLYCWIFGHDSRYIGLWQDGDVWMCMRCNALLRKDHQEGVNFPVH